MTEYQQFPSLEEMLEEERAGMMARAERAIKDHCISKYIYMHVEAYSTGCTKKHLDTNTRFVERYFELKDDGLNNEEAITKSLYEMTVNLFTDYYNENVERYK